MACHLLCARRSRARVPAGRGARRLRTRGDRARRHLGALLRPRRRLRAAARVDRGAPRRRAGARRHHERLAAGLRLPRRAARPAGRARARRGADVRPAAEDPRAPRRRDRRPADGRRGPAIDALERALADGEKPAFLYTIATFQNPSGRTLSEERRRRVAELAKEHDLLVLEDDPYGLVRYEGEALPTLFELEGGDERRLRVVVLEDGRAGRARRLLRAAAGARRADRGARGVDVHLAAVHDAGDGVRVPAARQLRAEPRARATGCSKARRDAMLEALERAHARRRDVEPARGRLLHLARPRRTRPASCSRAPRRRASRS